MATKLKPRPTSFRKPGTPKTATRKSIVSIPKLLPDQPGFASVTIAARGDRPEYQYRVFGAPNIISAGKIKSAMIELWKELRPGVPYSEDDFLQWEASVLTENDFTRANLEYMAYLERLCDVYYTPMGDAPAMKSLMLQLPPDELEDLFAEVMVFMLRSGASQRALREFIMSSQAQELSENSSSESPTVKKTKPAKPS